MNCIKQLLVLVVLTILVPYLTHGQDIRDKWDIADSLTVRLQPAEFDKLPQKIVHYLEENNYSIPQCGCKSEPHNIISGPFGKKQQIDWAVLASRNRVSGILVFWEGSINNISAVAKESDRTYLQGAGEGIVFSRRISTAGKSSILRGHENWGGPQLPSSIDHLGIEDIFVYKESTIHYYHNNLWIELPGSD